MLAMPILSPVMALKRLAVGTVSQINLWDTYLLCLLLAVSTASVQVLGCSVYFQCFLHPLPVVKMFPAQEYGLGKSGLTTSPCHSHKEQLAYKLPSGYSDTSLKSNFYWLLLSAGGYQSSNLLDLSLSTLFQFKKVKKKKKGEKSQ